MAKKNDISQEAFEERMIKSLPGDSSLIGKLFYYHLNTVTWIRQLACRINFQTIYLVIKITYIFNAASVHCIAP